MNKIEKQKRLLIGYLGHLKVGEGITLGDDTFLTGTFDGSDKLYGFINNGELQVVERSGEYPISELGKGELRYIFETSTPSIAKRLADKFYLVVGEDDI